MTNLRQAAQDVLELVEWIKDNLDVVRAGGDMGISPVLIDKLRAALAEHDRLEGIEAIEKDAGIHVSQQTEPEQEPQTTHWEGCEAVHPECKEKNT